MEEGEEIKEVLTTLTWAHMIQSKYMSVLVHQY